MGIKFEFSMPKPIPKPPDKYDCSHCGAKDIQDFLVLSRQIPHTKALCDKCLKPARDAMKKALFDDVET